MNLRQPFESPALTVWP